MEVQYLLFAVIITLMLFLIALGIQKTTKIFLGNYISGFSAVISYLFIDFLVNYIDNVKNLNIKNPDLVQGFLVNNKTMIIIGIYFIFFILFYKSKLFEVEINGFFKKIIAFLLFPILTVINLIFTMLLIINGPDILNYNGYMNVIKDLNITDPIIINFFLLIPAIIIIIPVAVLLLFLKINIRLNLKKRKKNKEEEKKENEEKEVKEEE